ncbi:MAG: hypothetical protein ABIZ49_06000, partial [Opitutaceae bacterium]
WWHTTPVSRWRVNRPPSVYEPWRRSGRRYFTASWSALAWRPQLDKAFYGPAERNVDLWIGYKRQLTKRIGWRAQLNVRNVGKNDDLIPINVQPDGTPVGYRIAPVQTWSLSNTLEF